MTMNGMVRVVSLDKFASMPDVEGVGKASG